MFYNALVRKNKSENVEEKDVAVIVAIHNNMNETTWKHVIQYEKLCHPEYPNSNEARDMRSMMMRVVIIRKRGLLI